MSSGLFRLGEPSGDLGRCVNPLPVGTTTARLWLHDVGYREQIWTHPVAIRKSRSGFGRSAVLPYLHYQVDVNTYIWRATILSLDIAARFAIGPSYMDAVFRRYDLSSVPVRLSGSGFFLRRPAPDQ